MTLEWKQDEDRDVWTARAGDTSISIYCAEISGERFWFSIGLGMPPMFLGYARASSMEMLQEGAEARLRLHLVRALEALGCEVMCWRRGDAQEAARVLGGRELRDLAALADVAHTVTDELPTVDRKLERLASTMPAAAAGGFATRVEKWLKGAPKPTAVPSSPLVQSVVSPRLALETRLLSGETVTWQDLRSNCDSGELIDDVLHVMNRDGLIQTTGRCPKTGLALWRAK